MMGITIADLPRAAEVTRWHIVRTKKEQSVAEHSFLVAVLALEIAEQLDVSEEICHDVVKYALFHDIAECLTGDIPSPMKSILGEGLAVIEQKVMRNYMRHVAVCDLTKAIVKAADIAEAIKFLMINKDSGHADSVYQSMLLPLEKHIGKSEELDGWNPRTVGRVVHQYLHGEEYTIDTFFQDEMK
jgi:5'-deoxynucleotidase